LTPQIVSVAAVERVASDSAGSDAAARTQLANAQFYRLLNSCVGALGESVRAADELAQRLALLREELEGCANGVDDKVSTAL